MWGPKTIHFFAADSCFRPRLSFPSPPQKNAADSCFHPGLSFPSPRRHAETETQVSVSENPGGLAEPGSKWIILKSCRHYSISQTRTLSLHDSRIRTNWGRDTGRNNVRWVLGGISPVPIATNTSRTALRDEVKPASGGQ